MFVIYGYDPLSVQKFQNMPSAVLHVDHGRCGRGENFNNDGGRSGR